MKGVRPGDRPRERLETYGVHGLGDNELLTIVLGSGSRTVGVVALANAILDHLGGLRGLAQASGGDLRRVTGIGAAQAARLVAAVELGRRTLTTVPPDRPQLNGPAAAAAYLLPRFGQRPVEHFGIVMLDTKHRVIRASVLSIGSLDSTIVHPREVFREAASARAAAIVLFHNHPSGDPSPSRDDIDLTARLIDAGVVMGITVVDHIILAETRYFSMAEVGGILAPTTWSGQGKIERL